MTLDKNGIEILPGDLLKIYHFADSKKKKHYVYKYVIGYKFYNETKYLEISHLNLRNETFCLPPKDIYDNIEIIQGYSDNGIYYKDRMKENKNG